MVNTKITFCVIFTAVILSVANCKVVKYNLTIFYFDGWPDGVYVKHILGVNGQFPGPTLEADVNDDLEVTVNNIIQDGQNTTLHWHGIVQKNSAFEDGTNMITQCPIPAGHSQVYKFKVTQAGTFWYHSHVSSQYTEGLFGALIVHGAPEAYHYDGEATLILSDWYHEPAHVVESYYLSQESFGQPPIPESILVNGMGRYPCPFALLQNKICRSRRQQSQVVRMERGRTYRLRLIQAAARALFNFSIAEHSLRVIEADGIDVASPVKTDELVISNGQRYSVLVRCNDNSTDVSRYVIRVTAHEPKVMNFPGVVNYNKYPEAFMRNLTAVLECTDEDLSRFKGRVEMKTEFNSWIFLEPNPPAVNTPPGPRFLNKMELSPLQGGPAPELIDHHFTVVATFLEDFDTDVGHPNFNYTTFTFPEDKPLLHKVIHGEPFANKMLWLDVDYRSNVQIVINNPFVGPHPFHLHGHHFWVVGIGEELEGNFDPSRHQLNLNGVKRDTVMVPDRSWSVIRFVADNPGVWLLHCHLDWHAVGGMGLAVVVGADLLRNGTLPIPDESIRVCNLNGI